MRNKNLGRSGIEVSLMGMGCWSFGGGAYWGEQSQKDVNEIVAAALDMGINFFDTAEMYNDGESEKSLGIALKRRRHKAVICSKANPANAYYDTLIEHCKLSLKRLSTDYLDIYMLHWPLEYISLSRFTTDENILKTPPVVEEAFGALMKLKKDGLIRSIGVSNFGILQLKEAMEVCDCIDCNEIAYNILCRAIENEIMPFCVEKDIGIIGTMTLQQGLLAGLYNSPAEVPLSIVHSRHFNKKWGNGSTRHELDGEDDETFKVINGIKRIAGRLGVSIAKLSAAWVFAEPGITSALIGSRDVKELLVNIQAADYVLSKDVINEIKELSRVLMERLGSNPDYYENAQNARIR